MSLLGGRSAAGEAAAAAHAGAMALIQDADAKAAARAALPPPRAPGRRSGSAAAASSGPRRAAAVPTALHGDGNGSRPERERRARARAGPAAIAAPFVTAARRRLVRGGRFVVARARRLRAAPSPRADSWGARPGGGDLLRGGRAGRRPSSAPAPGAAPVDAAVLGGPAVVVPVAAACAGELRARGRTAAALLCIWRPAGAPPRPSPKPASRPRDRPPARRRRARSGSPGGSRPTTFPRPPAGGSRGSRSTRILRARPASSGAPGRLQPCRSYWPSPARDRSRSSRCWRSSNSASPCSPRTSIRRCASWRSHVLPARNHAVVAPLPPGPPRWAAMAGLARLRSLPEAAPSESATAGRRQGRTSGRGSLPRGRSRTVACRRGGRWRPVRRGAGRRRYASRFPAASPARSPCCSSVV